MKPSINNTAPSDLSNTNLPNRRQFNIRFGLKTLLGVTSLVGIGTYEVKRLRLQHAGKDIRQAWDNYKVSKGADAENSIYNYLKKLEQIDQLLHKRGIPRDVIISEKEYFKDSKAWFDYAKESALRYSDSGGSQKAVNCLNYMMRIQELSRFPQSDYISASELDAVTEKVNKLPIEIK